MTQLEKIKLALEENPNIIIFVNIIDHLKGGCRDAYSSQVYDFQVAPKRRIALDKFVAEEMNEFMKTLIPGIIPNEIINFKEEEGFLVPGRLSFEELLAIETTNTKNNSIIYGEPQIAPYFKDSASIKVKNHMRRIYVSPFPNKKMARRYMNTNYIGYINLEEFRKKRAF